MKNDLTIIIAHYLSKNCELVNPLIKTINEISKQKNRYNIEVIIADDGSDYSNEITENYSKIIQIKDDLRSVYILEEDKLENFLVKNNFNNRNISKWVYLPKTIKCMSKARVTNYAVKESSSNHLLLLDDDNYFISKNSIDSLINLFYDYEVIIGQIQDNNRRLRQFSSTRVQGTTIGIKKNIFLNINGLGEWTEKFSCGIDSDFWIKLFSYHQKNNLYHLVLDT